MKKQFRSIGVVLGCILLTSVATYGQVSGVPGDGIPDLYYFQDDNSPAVPTSFGPQDRPGGTLLLDSDGFDVNTILVGGPNVTQAPACGLCEGFSLPQDGDPPLPTNNGNFTVGYSGTAPLGSTQWIRSNNPPPPAPQRGFVGVVGTGYIKADGTIVNSWPAGLPPILNYPAAGGGLANYGTGLTDASFVKVFNDGQTEALWSARIAAGTGPNRYTNVTIVAVPEPCSGLAGLVGFALVSAIRRRIG